MTVLALDPGTAATGYAFLDWNGRGPVVVCAGVFETERDSDLSITEDSRRRIAQILGDLEDVCRRVDGSRRRKITGVVVEAFASQRNLSWPAVQTLRLLGRVESWAEIHGWTYDELTTQQVKARIGAGRSATKEEVQRAVVQLTGRQLAGTSKAKREHEADAIAVGIAGGRAA